LRTSVDDERALVICAEETLARVDIPIILMSGFSGERLTERAHAAGVSDVLRKPRVSGDIAEPRVGHELHWHIGMRGALRATPEGVVDETWGKEHHLLTVT
jgi:PleD family two-component response regulator